MLRCIQNVIENMLLMSERTFIGCIGYSKAFDSVGHIHMFKYLINDMGFPRHIVALIQRSVRNNRRWYVGTDRTPNLSS